MTTPFSHTFNVVHQQVRPSPSGSGDDLLTVKEVAAIFRLDTSTVRRWIRNGKIPAVELPHSGTRTVYRIKRHTVQTLLVEHPMPE